MLGRAEPLEAKHGTKGPEVSGKKAKASLFERGQGELDTWTGPMGTATVAAQVLTVPVLFAVFAIAIVIMRRIIGF